MKAWPLIRVGVLTAGALMAGFVSFATHAAPAPPAQGGPAQETLDTAGARPVFFEPDSPGLRTDPDASVWTGTPWTAQACQEEYSSGPYLNSPGTGPSGTDESILQNASLGMSTVGYNCNASALSWLADDFVVAEPGLDVDQVLFYAYQTGSTTTSTITGARYQVWDGPPNLPTSSVLFGDLVTNRMTGTAWSNAYRRAETTPGNTTRPIMVQTCSAGFHLPAGTYWLQFGLTGTLSSGPWQPPVAIWGTPETGNALQYYMGFWTPLRDGGSGTPPQGVPFQLVRCCPSIAVEPLGPLTPGMTGVPYPPVAFSASTSNPSHLYDVFTWSIATGSLPDGLTMDPVTGVLSGTPTLDGIYNFTVRAQIVGFDGCSAESSYTIAIGCPAIALKGFPSDASGTVGAPILPVTFTASGGTPPHTFTVTGGTLPEGLKLSPDGTLSGIPTESGTFTFTVEATDANGCKGSVQYTVVIAAFDLNLFDDLGRSRVCVNTYTGAFTYTILAGYGVGSYAGKGTISVLNGQMTLVTPYGLPYYLSLKYLQRYHKATASFTYRPTRVTSSLTDNDTRNDPPGC